MARRRGRRGRRTRARIPSWQSARAGRTVSAGIATEAVNVCNVIGQTSPGGLTAGLEPGVAAAARVEPAPAKIGTTEPAEIEIATRVITAAGVVAGEAYVAATGG